MKLFVIESGELRLSFIQQFTWTATEAVGGSATTVRDAGTAA